MVLYTQKATSGDGEEVLSGMELDKDDSERKCALDFRPEEESSKVQRRL